MYGYGLTLTKKRLATQNIDNFATSTTIENIAQGKELFDIFKEAQGTDHVPSIPLSMKIAALTSGDKDVASLYGNKKLSRIEEDIKTFKIYLASNQQYVGVVKDKIKDTKDPLLLSKLNSELQRTQNRIYAMDNAIRILTSYLELRKYTQEEEERDKSAIARGYKDEEDAKAIRQVEIEWYFKLYGVSDPIDILGYQRIEKAKFGMTTYDAAIQGVQLEPLNTEEQNTAIVESDAISDNIAEAKSDRKRFYIFGGVGLVSTLAIIYFVRKK